MEPSTFFEDEDFLTMAAKDKGLVAVKKKKNELAPNENPLVRNATLREMYQKMVEGRLLEEHLLKLQRKTKGPRLASGMGQEACRVGLLQGIAAGDVVMESRADGGTEYLMGVKLPVVLRDAQALVSGSTTKASMGNSDVLLPVVEDADARLLAAAGAGLLLKKVGKKSVLVVYVGAGKATKNTWREVLKFAGRLDLPIIFAVLPPAAKRKGKDTSARVCEWAQKSGVPGIPVDASDAVALYRIAQESMGRIRGDGGPVLIECIPYQLAVEKKISDTDPIAGLRRFLLGRKICNAAWMEAVETRFRKRLAAI